MVCLEPYSERSWSKLPETGPNSKMTKSLVVEVVRVTTDLTKALNLKRPSLTAWCGHLDGKEYADDGSTQCPINWVCGCILGTAALFFTDSHARTIFIFRLGPKQFCDHTHADMIFQMKPDQKVAATLFDPVSTQGDNSI